MPFRRAFQAVDYGALVRAHTPPPEYFETGWLLAPEAIEARQLARLRDRARRAYEVPFFRRRWDAALVKLHALLQDEEPGS